MAMRGVETILCDDKIIVPSREDSDMLFQSSYGSMRKDVGLILSRCESLYLLAEERIKVLRGVENIEVKFKTLLEMFRAVDPEIWTRYLIFRDMRSRGYVIKEGVGWGIDFRVYERGTYRKKAAKYVVYAICEGNPITAIKLQEVLRLTHGIKRELVVAVVDRRGEIVYYSLSDFKLNKRSKD